MVDVDQISNGMNLREALKIARALGCDVHPRTRTGEIVVRHPGVHGRVVVNGRRKSATRALIRLLRAVASLDAPGARDEDTATDSLSKGLAMRIQDLIARRTDLSTFLVHLTRSHDGVDADERLEAILRQGRLVAGAPMGHAVTKLERHGLPARSQHCVAFTETPLEHVSLCIGDIDGRSCDFEPYGIAITKKQGRKWGVNPVWYLDITPGHDWLTAPVNELIDAAIAAGTFDNAPIAKLTPFIEQMGSGARALGGGYRKEFWWEREWRHVGDFDLPIKTIVLCPEREHLRFRQLLEPDEREDRTFIDPFWSLEQIIARVAGFSADDVGPI